MVCARASLKEGERFAMARGRHHRGRRRKPCLNPLLQFLSNREWKHVRALRVALDPERNFVLPVLLERGAEHERGWGEG